MSSRLPLPANNILASATERSNFSLRFRPSRLPIQENSFAELSSFNALRESSQNAVFVEWWMCHH